MITSIALMVMSLSLVIVSLNYTSQIKSLRLRLSSAERLNVALREEADAHAFNAAARAKLADVRRLQVDAKNGLIAALEKHVEALT